MSRTTLACLLTLALSAAVSAQDPVPASDPTYAALRGAQPDGRQVAVSGFRLTRDAFTFELSGTFHLLQPVGGREVGALFSGTGRLQLNPATEDERRHLAMVSGKPVTELYEDTIDKLVLFFTDETSDQIQAAGELKQAAAAPEAVEALADAIRWQRKEFYTNFQLRILQDLLKGGEARDGVFIALLDGDQLAESVLVVDPLGAGASRLTSNLGSEKTMLYNSDSNVGGIWYCSHTREEVDSGSWRSIRPLQLFDAQHYEIETTISRGEQIDGVATITFEPLVGGERVVPVHLYSRLRISEATWLDDGQERPLGVVQEEREEDADAAVVFPEPLAEGTPITFRLRYAGDRVIKQIVGGAFFVQRRTTWYPNLSTFEDGATFDLHFHHQKAFEVIATGDRVDVSEADSKVHAHWRSEIPLVVAGFNYGEFERKDVREETTGTKIEVYSYRSGGGADDAAADAMNSIGLFSSAFGNLPFERIAVTQQLDFGHGQAWPGLVFMPGRSFVNQTDMASLGAFGTEFRDVVGPHELAHQWWGHVIVWESYRDQWLSEGFSHFSASYLIEKTHGWPAHDQIWESRRDTLMADWPGSQMANYQTGPISRGTRLSTRQNPYGYQTIVYSKGGFVLHMLRMAMRDWKSAEPDARFLAMMQDFTSTYSGKLASTEDFKRMVEKHIIPELNPNNDGKVDWFFDQWVHGTEIPRYDVDVEISSAGGGRYQLEGTISQNEVSPDFMAIVPVYADLGKERVGVIARMPFKGEMSHTIDTTVGLPVKPRAIVVAAHHDVLHRGVETKKKKKKR